jgi:hypothetical protein
MSHSDKRISALVATVILIHIAIFVTALLRPTLSYLTASTNLVVGSSICIYWFQKQLRITRHIFELREIIALTFEVVVIGCSIYSILLPEQIAWLNTVNLFILIVHLLMLLIFLVFMLTFKAKKLF